MYSLSSSYSANYIHSKPYGSSRGDLRVYIPTIMPLIAMGMPKTIPVTLNKSCYCNASDCKPTIAPQLNTQNFVTALSYNSYVNPCYRYGDILRVVAKSDDFLTCHLSPSEADNSIEWP